MRPVYTNRPINRPERRREPAGKTLAVMSVVLAMMFGVKLFYGPAPDRQEEQTASVPAVSAAWETSPSDKRDDGEAIMVFADEKRENKDSSKERGNDN